MSELKKSLLGLAAFWPIGYIIFFLIFILSMLSRGPQMAETMNQWFLLIFALHFLTIISVLAQTIYYIFHIMKKNTQLDETNRIIWVLMLFFINILAIPAYWFMHISKDETPEYG